MLSKKQFGILLAMSICSGFIGGAVINYLLYVPVTQAASEDSESVYNSPNIKANRVEAEIIYAKEVILREDGVETHLTPYGLSMYAKEKNGKLNQLSSFKEGELNLKDKNGYGVNIYGENIDIKGTNGMSVSIEGGRLKISEKNSVYNRYTSLNPGEIAVFNGWGDSTSIFGGNISSDSLIVGNKKKGIGDIEIGGSLSVGKYLTVGDPSAAQMQIDGFDIEQSTKSSSHRAVFE